MKEFIEINASGNWDDDLQDYLFEDVDKPAYFSTDIIEWFEINHDDMSVIFGCRGYTTVFKSTNSAAVAWFIARKNGWKDE